MTFLIISILVLIVLSGLLAGIEAALFSVNPVKVNELASKGQKSAMTLKKIKDSLQRPIAAIVILTNLVNIVGSIFVGGVASQVFGSQWVGLFSGLLTFLIIIFAEIIPKNLGEFYCLKISQSVAAPVEFITKLLTPFIVLIDFITKPFLPGRTTSFTTNENEIRLLVKVGHKEGTIKKQEQELILKAFELDDTKASDIATPRTAMTFLRGHKSLEECTDEIIGSQHTRIIIVGETRDVILGFARKDQLLTEIINNKKHHLISEFSQEILRFGSEAPASHLLSTFQKKRQHIGIVEDNFGGVMGVVSLEDVIEILAGEIVDEIDEVVDLRELAKIKSMRSKTSKDSS